MNITNTYDIINTPKLIDLNKNFVKFECVYKVDSPTPFHLAAVNQKMLDNEINFKGPQKHFEGSVKYAGDENIPHYLILKADTNCKVTVSIKCKPLESPITMKDYKEPINQQVNGVTYLANPTTPPIKPMYYQHPTVNNFTVQNENAESRKTSIGKIILIIILILFIVFIFWTTRASANKISKNSFRLPIQSISNSEPEILTTIPMSIKPETLLDKLKQFPILKK